MVLVFSIFLQTQKNVQKYLKKHEVTKPMASKEMAWFTVCLILNYTWPTVQFFYLFISVNGSSFYFFYVLVLFIVVFHGKNIKLMFIFFQFYILVFIYIFNFVLAKLFKNLSQVPILVMDIGSISADCGVVKYLSVFVCTVVAWI